MSDTGATQAIEQLMRQQRLDEAIVASKAHLRAHPEDLEALLRLGICCLLSRAEDDFASIHEQAAGLVERRRQLPARTAELWQLYQRLFARWTAPLMIVGASSLAACDRNPEAPATPEPLPAVAPSEQPQGPTSTPTESEPTATEAAAEPSPPPAGSAAASATDSAESVASSTASGTGSGQQSAAATSKPVRPPTVSAHRYSAGVYRPPSPATHHKYSGGVYRR